MNGNKPSEAEEFLAEMERLANDDRNCGEWCKYYSIGCTLGDGCGGISGTFDKWREQRRER